MNEKSLAYAVGTLVLRVVLVLALAAAIWSVYRGLPAGGARWPDDGGESGETRVSIVLRVSPRDAAALNIPVSFYPVDVAAVRREFESERRPGVRFESFLKSRMQGQSPVETTLDERGRTIVNLPPGKWWLHAVFKQGAEDVQWQLPLNVGGRQQIIELTPENAYARIKSF